MRREQLTNLEQNEWNQEDAVCGWRARGYSQAGWLPPSPTLHAKISECFQGPTWEQTHYWGKNTTSQDSRWWSCQELPPWRSWGGKTVLISWLFSKRSLGLSKNKRLKKQHAWKAASCLECVALTEGGSGGKLQHRSGS